jgi:DNA/RNA-binding domain of Phe-tRNA-synthetase-like protein
METRMIELSLDSNVRDRWSGEAVLGLIVLEDLIDTTTTSPQLKAEIKSMISELRAKGTAILDDPVVQRMRATFKAMPDMDPSRYRPASEALIRRCLEKDFVRINPIVDVNNILSIRLRVPLGIYDLDRMSPACSYRTGDAGETYTTISQMIKNADGKLVLADASGIVGSPVSDSGRAAIRKETARVVVIAYLPFDTGTVEAESINAEIEAAFVRHFCAKPTQRVILAKGG